MAEDDTALLAALAGEMRRVRAARAWHETVLDEASTELLGRIAAALAQGRAAILSGDRETRRAAIHVLQRFAG